MPRPRRQRNPMRRRGRKPRIPLYKSAGSRMIEKVYRYQFSPPEQYLVNNQEGVLGSVVLTGGVKPLTAGFIGSPVASATGIVNTYDFGVGVRFQLKDMDNWLAFSSIYDNYRLRQVQFTLEDMTGGSLEGSYQVNPTIYAYVDHDDIVTPVSAKDITGRQGHKVWTMNNKNITKYSINIRPKASALVRSTNDAGVGDLQISDKGWLDCAHPDVNYYGLKLWFSDLYLGGTNANVAAFRIRCKYIFEFKGAMTLN